MQHRCIVILLLFSTWLLGLQRMPPYRCARSPDKQLPLFPSAGGHLDIITGSAKSSHNHSSVQSPLIWVYRGICHAGKLAVTKHGTSRHIICYFGPGVWQIMSTVWRSHWLQWLASPEWVITSPLNNSKRNNFVFSLQLKTLKRENEKVMFGELFYWIDPQN